MADHRDQNRQQTHDTGSATARARDDLRTASKKSRPNESRDEKRDREEPAKKDDDDEQADAG